MSPSAAPQDSFENDFDELEDRILARRAVQEQAEAATMSQYLEDFEDAWEGGTTRRDAAQGYTEQRVKLQELERTRERLMEEARDEWEKIATLEEEECQEFDRAHGLPAGTARDMLRERHGYDDEDQEEDYDSEDERILSGKGPARGNAHVNDQDRELARARAGHETAWAALQEYVRGSAAGANVNRQPLRWLDIPWPTRRPPLSPEALKGPDVEEFIVDRSADAHAQREAVRSALLRWHPDRFESRLLQRCAEEDRDNIKAGVGIVVRTLNQLLV